MSQKIEQPTAQPTRKMSAVGIAGALATVVTWAAGQAGLDMPPEVAAAIALVLAWAVGYFTLERSP